MSPLGDSGDDGDCPIWISYDLHRCLRGPPMARSSWKSKIGVLVLLAAIFVRAGSALFVFMGGMLCEGGQNCR